MGLAIAVAIYVLMMSLCVLPHRWPGTRRRREAARGAAARSPDGSRNSTPHTTAPPGPAVDEASGISTERAEVLLVRARLTGRMEPDDYQRQMAVVARSDDVRNPLEVPRLRGR